MLPINTDIAIIGAGNSGSFIASQLTEEGVDLGALEVLIDLASNRRLTKHTDAWVKDGSLQTWSYQASYFNRIDQRKHVTSLCGTPSMSTWHKHITHHVSIRNNCKIDSITQFDKHWHPIDDSGQLISKAKQAFS